MDWAKILYIFQVLDRQKMIVKWYNVCIVKLLFGMCVLIYFLYEGEEILLDKLELEFLGILQRILKTQKALRTDSN